MDVQSGIVCALVFVVSAVLLLLISKFGMREKSYEEALAEQRKLTSGLLGPQHRPKPKEKKQKKVGKKVKEKVSAPVETSTEESEAADAAPLGETDPIKHHVEFEETQTNNTKKRAKKEKVKPILLNKEKSPTHEENLSKIQAATNHFEQSHPKDDFELLTTHQKDEPIKQDLDVKLKKMKLEDSKLKTKEKKQSPGPVAEKKSAVAAPLKDLASTKEVTVPKEVQEQPVAVKFQQQPQQQANGVKEKKKKKSEFNTLQQLTAGDKHDVNVGLLVALVRKSELVRSEIQILIDLLLNKQHEAPAVIDEWSEGRADPVQKLKKQLAEKERALAEEQEALTSAQAKLREMRAEFNQERSRLTQNCRNFEESLLAKRTEAQSAAARMHAQAQQCQQLQAQLNDEMVKSRAIADELKTMQMQRQQLDMHINQKQEAESSFQSQLGQLRSELQEAQALNGQLNMEVRTIREKSHAEMDMLHERIRQSEGKALHYKNESDQKQEMLMELEDSRRLFNDLKLTYDALLRNEHDLKLMCTQHQDEARRSATIHHDDITKLQSEITRINVLNKVKDDDHLQLIADLKSKLSSVQAEGAGDKTKDVEIRNLENELSSLHAVLEQREAELNSILVIIDKKNKMINELDVEVEAQKSKNDELRKKNWKIMDALNASDATQRKQLEDVALKKLISDEQLKYKSFVQRLFPDIPIANTDRWLTEAELGIKTYITELQTVKPVVEDNSNQSKDVEQLQTELKNYKTIIDDTEAMLKHIQSEVGNEESKWRKQLEEKDAQLAQLKEYHRKQLQTQLEELTDQLGAERQAQKQQMSRASETKSATASLASVEQMAEERSRLADDLAREQKRSQDLSEEIQRLKIESQPIKAVQNHTANGTTLETSEAAVVN